VALVEREGGRSVAKPTIDAGAETLAPIVRANVDLSATFMTDAWRGYITVGRESRVGLAIQPGQRSRLVKPRESG
jgi:hypothetical protein